MNTPMTTISEFDGDRRPILRCECLRVSRRKIIGNSLMGAIWKPFAPISHDGGDSGLRGKGVATTIIRVCEASRVATATHLLTEKEATARPPQEAVVVRFAGDSGDGMQLTGGQFTLSTALAGNDLATFPDFPAEIRAPQGTTFGVSAFQINFGSSQSILPATSPTSSLR